MFLELKFRKSVMLVLGLEASTFMNSVAVTQNGELKGQFLINQAKSKKNNLIQLMDYILKSANVNGRELDGISVSIGPGSYTGLRISLSIAKSLAFCWEKPLTVVNSLDALAQHGRNQNKLICPLIRFRSNEYFYAFFTLSNSKVERQSEYFTNTLDDIVKDLKQPVYFVGLLRKEDKDKLSSLMNNGRDYVLSNSFPEARWIALLGELNLKQVIKEDIQHVTPYYMHDFPIKN